MKTMLPAKTLIVHLIMLLLLWSLPEVCRAHDLHLTGVKMIWNQNQLVVSVLTPASPLKTTDYDAAIRRRLKLRLDDEPFKAGQSTLSLDKSNDFVRWQTSYAGRATRIELLARFYPEDPSSRLVLTVFREGRLVQETILDASHPSFVIGIHSQNTNPLTVAGRFLRLGTLHIFGGVDHICFLLGLLLLGSSLRQLLKTITAFTLAHSITLSLSVLGIVVPSPRLVEPLIAVSIIAIAFENVRASRRQNQNTLTDWRPLIAFSFGLIHGFGFASALAGIDLPRAVLGWALVSFNVGVELGQCTLVLLFAPIIFHLAYKRKNIHQRVVLVGSWAIGAIGLFWLVQRIVSS